MNPRQPYSRVHVTSHQRWDPPANKRKFQDPSSSTSESASPNPSPIPGSFIDKPTKQERSPRKKRFVWPDDLHLDFVAAVFDLGLKYASADGIFENIPDCEQLLTIEDLHEHMHEYRERRTQFKEKLKTGSSSPYTPGSSMEHLSVIHPLMCRRFVARTKPENAAVFGSDGDLSPQTCHQDVDAHTSEITGATMEQKRLLSEELTALRHSLKVSHAHYRHLQGLIKRLEEGGSTNAEFHQV